MSVSEYRHSTPVALTAALADFIESELNAAVASRGQASMVVSGGSTPKALFAELSQRSLPWNKITVTLADERWVDPSDKDSNEAMLRETLLTNAAAKARFVALKNNAETAAGGLPVCEQAIADIPQPFDLVVLGMGDDGHTASLFPGVAGTALDATQPTLCAAIRPATAAHERMSLTATALLRSRKIILHMVGENKWQVYRQASQMGSADEFPVRVVLHQHDVPVEVYWSP